MQRKRNKRKKSPEADQVFPKFLKQMRNEQKIYLKQLSKGLMTASQLARIEKGERPICKNMRDRLLGRLGIASDLYENLLNIDDYKAWEQQRNIMYAIEQKDVQTAQELLNAYEKQKSKAKDEIKQQFCLVMRAEILKQQKANPCEIGACYEKAVKLSVPDVEHLSIAGRLLAIQEVNMILEYVFYHKDEDFANKCKEMMMFVEKSLYDNLSKVKIYPKIVYYYLQGIFTGQSRQSLEEMSENLEICNRAIEMLRDTGRAYYLLELLEMKIKITEYIQVDMEKRGNVQGLEELISARQESAELADLLKKLYDEYEVPAYMQDCVYLYQQRWIFYIGDVLRMRRKMCGFTQQKLCEGVCSVKTLRRAENMQTNMQHKVLGALLGKLGLSKEFQRTFLVTNDKEVIKLSDKITLYRNNHEVGKARELLRQIVERVSIKIPENQQYIMELEASLDWMEGRITEEEFAIKIEKALQCTLNINQLFRIEELYLTEMELLCIYKIMQKCKGAEKRKYIDFLLHLFEQYEKSYALSDCIVMYECIMAHIASEMGNMGEYQAATQLDKKVLKESLRCRRAWAVSKILYDILWNEKEELIKYGQFIGKEKMTESLRHCSAISHFCRQIYNEKFFGEKIHQL